MPNRAAYLKMIKQKNFFELMNNSPYGKTIENVTKRNTNKLFTNSKKGTKCSS